MIGPVSSSITRTRWSWWAPRISSCRNWCRAAGEAQFSYAGLWDHGRPVAGFTARRTRQYPLEFSYTSTFVETVDAPDVQAASERFLGAIGHHGLVEIEYKRDARDGQLKLLDINPRPWSWFSLAAAAGVDFGAAIARGGRQRAGADDDGADRGRLDVPGARPGGGVAGLAGEASSRPATISPPGRGRGRWRPLPGAIRCRRWWKCR